MEKSGAFPESEGPPYVQTTAIIRGLGRAENGIPGVTIAVQQSSASKIMLSIYKKNHLVTALQGNLNRACISQTVGGIEKGRGDSIEQTLLDNG
ncbi:hypothetical protein GE061_005555 [Apolygus lucorum]|uniref:Uncharacterized protein n=1 Tax=Apolygus lucorum TaxID=248454 RepID=A0A8S9WYC7_APOLU|nr:hypothetical protein GE061_005555 [Apolygus lucorum]